MFSSPPLFLKRLAWVVAGLMLLPGFFGCAKAPETGAPVPTPRRIAEIKAKEDPSAARVILKGSGPLTYTSVKQSFPLGVILYLPETDLALASPNLSVSGKTINKIITSKAGPDKTTSRVEIILKEDLPYEVKEEGTDLIVIFPRGDRVTARSIAPESAAPPKAPPAPSLKKRPSPAPKSSVPPIPAKVKTRAVTRPKASGPAATTVKSVSPGKTPGGMEVLVEADGEIRDFKTFAIKNPPRVVYDLFHLKSRHKGEKKISVGEKGVEGVRYYNHPDRFRVVIDTSSEYLGEFRAVPVPSGLLIRLGKGASLLAAPAPAAVKAVSPNHIRNVDLSRAANGVSSLRIETAEPVRYEMLKKGDKGMELVLYNTGLYGYRYIPPLTPDLYNPVTRVSPFQKGDTARITIRLREPVPYRVEQSAGLIALHFEPVDAGVHRGPIASRAFAPPVKTAEANAPETAGAKLSKSAEANTPSEIPPGATASRGGAPAPAVEPEASEAAAPKKEGKKYTGEKIALDFFETDIKNVFRILQTVSNKNFAIDKSVAGKVTMTLDKPVPWDQVLDLVLKMNQLGMAMDGDIVRIASLDTFRKEQELEQAKIKAELKSREQAKALEPLVTEYISVNYSKAVEDVLSHVENVITPERGKVSADPRNNQIIISDVASKIEEAKRVIREIDKVTPQVMISARIIEVTDDFSKDLGVVWNASLGPVESWKDNLGGDLKLDSSFNFPSGSNDGIGLSFDRIAGTPFSLNAKLTALEQQGDAKIISSPKIITLDNKKAMIKQGFEVPYLERDESGSSTAFKQVDLLLEVTPHVTPDQRVSLDVNITKNDVSGVTSDGQPVLSTNQAQTTLLVNDGNTIVIGGILKSTKTSNQRRFPGLHKLPYLGNLFKSDTETDDKTELMIFITPTIIQLEQK